MDSKTSNLTFNSLNDDVRHHILRYFGEKSYMIFGSINKNCNNLFEVKDIPKKTSLYAHGPLGQIIQIYDKRQEYKETDDFWEFEGNSQYDDGVDYICYRLAKSIVLHGRKDVFAWALKKKDQDVLQSICSEASKVGKLEIIQEVFSNADEEERDSLRKFDGNSISTHNAAMGGHFETLIWLRLNGFRWESDFRWDSVSICSHVASSGNIEMLNWLLANPRFCYLNESACSHAAWKGHLEVLKILKEKGCPWNSDTCVFTSSGGHLDVLKWSHKNGCELHERCSEYAARGGHLECLKYLHENNCPWNSDIALVASRGGHLHILKYLYSNGCEWNTEIPREVTWRDHYHILEWIHYRGFGFDKEFTVYLASHNKLHILKWMHHCGYEMYEEMPSVAARNKSFDTLRWLREIGIKWDEYGKYLDDDTNEKLNKKRKMYK